MVGENMATIKELLGDAYKDGMTIEEVETALAGRKIADLSSGDYVSKGKLTDYEMRAKKAEEELRKRMTDDEKRAQENADRESYYKAIERENALYKYKAELAKSINDNSVLEKIATLFADGNYSEAIKAQSEYFSKERENIGKQVREELLRTNPTPAPQSDNTPTKKASEYSMDDWNKLRDENPQEYKKLLGTIK